MKRFCISILLLTVVLLSGCALKKPDHPRSPNNPPVAAEAMDKTFRATRFLNLTFRHNSKIF